MTMTAESAGAGRRDRERPPTITEVAGHAGVSIATVSHPVRTLTDRAGAAPLDQRLPTHLMVRASSAT